MDHDLEIALQILYSLCIHNLDFENSSAYLFGYFPSLTSTITFSLNSMKRRNYVWYRDIISELYEYVTYARINLCVDVKFFNFFFISAIAQLYRFYFLKHILL